jgi:hypothetical protein
MHLCPPDSRLKSGLGQLRSVLFVSTAFSCANRRERQIESDRRAVRTLLSVLWSFAAFSSNKAARSHPLGKRPVEALSIEQELKGRVGSATSRIDLPRRTRNTRCTLDPTWLFLQVRIVSRLHSGRTLGWPLSSSIGLPLYLRHPHF